MSKPAASPFPDIKPPPSGEDIWASIEAENAKNNAAADRRNVAGMTRAPIQGGPQFGDNPLSMAAVQSGMPGAITPPQDPSAPFGMIPPSLAAAQQMTSPLAPPAPPGAPPQMAQQPPVAGLVPPGTAPGMPAGPGPAAAPPVMAQGGDAPAGGPTEVSARRRDVPPAAAAAALDQAAAEPSFMDRARTAGGAVATALRESSPHLIALGAGLAGEGWGTAASLAAARNKKAEDTALQAQQSNATARLLASKGASPQEIAAAVAGGPDTIKALIGQYIGGKDKFSVVQTGEIEDAYGGKRKVFKILNAADGTMKEVPADSAAEAKQIASGEAPELNDSQKNRVRAIIEGRESYPAMSRATDAAKIRAAVHAEDPNFDAVNYNSRSQTRLKFTKGKGADNLTAFNTAIGHLGSLDKSIDNLSNSGFPAWNKYIANPIAEQFDPKYQKGLKEFQTARTAVADELTRAFRGSGGNVHDIIQWENAINSADSPVALKAAVRAAAELLNSRISSIGDEYNRGMGTTKDPLELLNPKAAEAFKRMLEGSRPSGDAAKAVKPGNYVYKNGVLVPE
jgi:hypothetical protein